MELTKETLKVWLDLRPALSPRLLALEAGLNMNYIYQLYNKNNRSLTQDGIEKLLPVLKKYGWFV